MEGICKNGIVLSVILLNDLSNLRLCRAVLCSASVLKQWHTEQVRDLRSGEASFKWMKGQLLDNKMLKHCHGMFLNMSSESQMERCMFVTSPQGAKQALGGQHVVDDEVADYLGSFCTALAGARMARLLYMWGPPHSFLFAHHPQADVQKSKFMLFKKDVQAYEQLKALDQKSALHLQMLRIGLVIAKCCLDPNQTFVIFRLLLFVCVGV